MKWKKKCSLRTWECLKKDGPALIKEEKSRLK